MYYLLKEIVKNDQFDIEMKSNIIENQHVNRVLIHKHSKEEVAHFDGFDKSTFRPVTKLKEPYNHINKSLYNKVLKHRLKKFVTKNELNIYGGVMGRTYIDSINVHVDNKYRCAIDISNFFTSIKFERVYDYFKTIRKDKDVAMIMTLLCTYNPNGCKTIYGLVVAQGFNTSMALAYLANQKMFVELDHFFKKNGLSYSVFVDDVTFSSKKFINQSVINDVISIIRKHGYRVNTKVHNGELTPIHNVVKYKGNTKFIKEQKERLKSYHDRLKNKKIISKHEYKMCYIPLIAQYMGLYNNIKQVDSKQIKKYHIKMYNIVKEINVNFKYSKFTNDIIVDSKKLDNSYKSYLFYKKTNRL